jgi:hypothetical protein
VNLLGAFATGVSALTLSFVALLGVFFVMPYRITRPTLLLWVPLAATLVLSWRIAYQRIFVRAIFAGNLLVIADRRLFERVWTEAAAGLSELYHVLEVIEPERPDLAAHLGEAVNGPVNADVVVGFEEGACGKLLGSLVACCERGVRVGRNDTVLPPRLPAVPTTIDSTSSLNSWFPLLFSTHSRDSHCRYTGAAIM